MSANRRSGRGSVEVAHYRVFERGPGGGNPCPIIVDASGLSAADMQAIAAHLGEESGFLSHDGGDGGRADSGDGDGDGGVRLRFFMPSCEVAMCVHATVAAVTWLVANGNVAGRAGLTVRTASGDCRVSWEGAERPRVTVEQQRPCFGPPLDVAATVEQALRLAAGSVDAGQPIRSVSVSTPKLLVPLRDPADVHRADPDFELLWELCSRHGTTGAYVFASHACPDASHFAARQFPLGGGIREDPATGVAAGALAAHVAERAQPRVPTWCAVEIDQGDAMGRPCRLAAAAYAKAGSVLRTTVTGSASLVGQERLELAAAVGERGG